MRERGLLDRNGGSLSLRSDDDRVFITPTRAAFRRWQISEDEIVAMDMNGERIDDSPGHAAAGGTFFLQLYKQFPLARAIAHSHCSYCLLFASAGAAVPQTTTASDVLGEVPCIIPSESDIDIKSRVVTQPSKVRIPSALSPRQDVYAVNNALLPKVMEKLHGRESELRHHGLAFTLYRHGIVVLARHIEEATENVERVETSARVAYLAETFGSSRSSRDSLA